MDLTGALSTFLSGGDVSDATQSIPSVGTNPSTDTGMFGGMTTGSVIAGFVISFIGILYFKYGKKDGNYMVLVSGLSMIVFPYFIYDLKYMILTTIILCALPFFIKF